jgi:chemotaxis protein CheD
MSNVLKHFLLPGTIKVSSKEMNISTLLGSCVAICLWDTKLHQGGINHYMLPLWNGQGLASPKYGNIAIEKLIKNLINIGSEKKDLVAKVFGGAAVINSSDCVFNIGERNIEIQESILHDNGIKVVAKSVGGQVGRKLIFNTETGTVRMKYIKKTKNEPS